MHNITPFDLFSPFLSHQSPNVIVVSDTEYKQYLQDCAQREITVLESKRNRYQAAIADIDKAILNKQENAGLLPSSPESEAPASTK